MSVLTADIKMASKTAEKAPESPVSSEPEPSDDDDYPPRRVRSDDDEWINGKSKYGYLWHEPLSPRPIRPCRQPPQVIDPDALKVEAELGPEKKRWKRSNINDDFGVCAHLGMSHPPSPSPSPSPHSCVDVLMW